uniref:Fibrinogen C-terminal domain-containing protein n=1 Tax=Oryzias latipes TaxID=8090 RepID=A0A3P9MQI1_ORYLA
MKLTAPCVFGSLLAFLSLSWIKADDEVVLKGQGFGPCVATLRPERGCSPGQHDATCPYLLHLPPLTVHLPQQFQELERIMQDLQKLKESVDELREMCANCTVSQTGGECGRQSGEHEKMTAGKGTREDERTWVRVILEKNDGDFREDCEKDKKTKKTYGDNTDDWLVHEGMEDKKLEGDKTNNKKEIAEKETKEIMVKNNKNTKTGKAKPFDETQMSTADPNGSAADLTTEKVAEKNHSEPERNKEDSTKEDTRIYPTESRQSEEEKYIQKYTKTKETDGIFVSANQEYGEETKKTLGDGVKVNRNNEKPEQTELTENERTIKEMGLDEKSRAIGKEIKTERVNGDGDGELSPSKTTKRADFVSISPTPQFKMRTASRVDLIDSRKVRTFTSSLPLPSFPISPLSSITDVSQSTAASRGPTQSTGPYTAGVPGPRSFDADLSTDTLATTTVGGPGLQTVPNSASTRKLEGQLQGTSTTTPTTIHQTPYMTTSPSFEDDSHWKSKTTGRRPQLEQDIHADKKPPLGTKPEAKKKLKNPPNKPGQALSPVKKSPPHQKEKPSLQKPKANKAKPDRDSIQPKNVKPVQKRFPDISKPNKNQKNNSIDTHKQGQPPDQDEIPSQSITFPLKSPPAVLKPTTHRPQIVNTTLSDELSSKTGGLTPKQEENHLIKSNILSNENPLPGSNSNSESKYEENVSEQDNITPEQDVESDLKIPTGHLNQEPEHELESNSNQKATARPDEKHNIEIIKEFKENKFLEINPGPNQNNTWPTKRPTLSRNFSKMNQTSKLDQAPKQNPKFKKTGTGLNINPNKKPKPGQPPQTNLKPKAPRPGLKPHPGFTPVQDKFHKAQSNRTTKPRPPYRIRPPTRPTLEPPAEIIHKPNPEVQPQPKLTMKSGANPTQSSRNYETLQPIFGYVKEITEDNHAPLDKSFNVSFKKTITEQPNNPIYSRERFDDKLLLEPKSNLYSTSEEEKRSQLVTSTADWDMKPTQKTSTVHQNPKKIKELESADAPTPAPKHLEGLRDISGNPTLHKTKPKEESEPRQRTTSSVQTTAWPTKRPTLSRNFSKMNQTSKLDQAPKQNPKFKKPGTGLNIEKNIKSKPGQPPQTNPKIKTSQPGQKTHPGFTPFWDKIYKAQSNRTTKPRPPYRVRPSTRPRLEPPAEKIQKPNPEVQPQPKLTMKSVPNPTQSSRNYKTMQPTFGFVKRMTEDNHAPLDKSSIVSFKKTTTEQPNNPMYSTERFDDKLLLEPKSNLYSTSEEKKKHQLVTSTADWDMKPTQKTSTVHQNPKKIKELESADAPTPAPKHLEEIKDVSGDKPLLEPKSKEESKTKLTTTSVQTTAWPTKRPTLSRNFSKMNQTSKLDQAPKQNPKFKKPGTGLNINPNKKTKPGQPPQTNPKFKAPRPGLKPHSGFTPVQDKFHKAQSNRTTKPRPPYLFRPPTRPTLVPPAETIQKPNPEVQPQPKLTMKSGANPTQSSRNYETMQPKFGYVKEITEDNHAPLDKSSNVSFKKTITEQPNNPIYSRERFDDKLLLEPKSNLYSTSEEEKRSQLVTSTADWDMKPTQKTSTVHQNPKSIKELESADAPTPAPKHLEGLRDISGNPTLHETKSKEEPEPKLTTTSVQTTAWPTKRPTLSRNFSKMNQTSKLDQAPKQNPKFKKPGTGLNIKKNIKSKPGQPPQTNPKVKTSQPGQKTHPGFTPFWDKIYKAQSNRTTKPRPPYRVRPSTRPTLESPAETNKRVNPAVQPKPNVVNKTTPTHISWTSSDAFQNTNTNVISSTIPGSTPPSGVPKFDSTSKIALSVEKSTLATTVPNPSSKTTLTISPDFRSVTTATSGFDPQTSADSTLELRVKINQVAAFPFNSQSPNRRPADEHPRQIPRGTDRDKTYRQPDRFPFPARRDCAELLMLGNKHSGIYRVSPNHRHASFNVFCDMEQEGGGWTVLQRRMDGSVSFNRTWAEYRSGFGELSGEFWLGNNMIHLLTHDRDMVLRVELEDFNGVREHAQYAHFSVAGEQLQYRLTVGGYTGTAGDALLFSRMYNHNNKAFTTPDKDNDRYPSGNCGAYYSSGWWFDACMAANLNGRYYAGPYKGLRDGIFWGTWPNISREYYPTNDRHSFKNVRMMIRPVGFLPP